MGSVTGMVYQGLRPILPSQNHGFKGLHNLNRVNYSPRSFTTSRISIPSSLQPQFKTSNQSDVALSITKNLFLEEEWKDKNVVFSPLSLHVALSMIAVGSDGSTLNELLTFLRAESTDDLNSFASQLASFVLRDAAPSPQ